MTSYPVGCIRNAGPEYGPMQPRPVDDGDWRMFSDQETADRGFGMIDALCDEASMVDAEILGGIYTKFIYLRAAQAATIHCRVVNAKARDEDGPMKICEYPSDLVDRDTTPMPFIDQYTAGQPHTLKVMRLDAKLGCLYWAAA